MPDPAAPPSPSLARFPPTQPTWFQAVRDPAVLEQICRLYWEPLYAFIRRSEGGASPADAQDYVQGFLAGMVDADFLARVDAERGRFRSFLKQAFIHYVRNERRAARALRRGGPLPPLSLDAAGEDGPAILPEPAITATPDEAYDAAWARRIMRTALRRLEEEFAGPAAGRFLELSPWLTRPPVPGEYEALAARRGVGKDAVAQDVLRLRRRLRALAKDEVLATVADPVLAEEELRYLLRVLVAGGADLPG
ncbi:MAG: sigma-70 family RNA polymerase sigma factor [Limisphaerales bacterium]